MKFSVVKTIHPSNDKSIAFQGEIFNVNNP